MISVRPAVARHAKWPGCPSNGLNAVVGEHRGELVAAQHALNDLTGHDVDTAGQSVASRHFVVSMTWSGSRECSLIGGDQGLADTLDANSSSAFSTSPSSWKIFASVNTPEPTQK